MRLDVYNSQHSPLSIPEGLRGRDPQILGRGIVESSLNIIVSYNVQEFEMLALPKVVTFQK